jgi:hypothetical protein
MPNAGFKDGVPSASILYSTLNTQISKIINTSSLDAAVSYNNQLKIKQQPKESNKNNKQQKHTSMGEKKFNT